MRIAEAEVVAALPPSGFLHDYVSYAARCTDAHVLYHVGTGLCLLAQTCPPGLAIPFGGTPMFSHLFVLIVGPSTESRKTVAINVGRNLLQAALPSSLAETPGSREGLIEGLRFSPRQLVTYGEFGHFLSAAEKGYLEPLKTALNDAFDGSALGRALAKKRSGAVENPRLSLLAGCAPGYLERHTSPVDWTEGFMARFLTFATTRERTYDLPGSDPAEQARLVMLLRSYADLSTQPGPCLGFDAVARELWREWHGRLNHRRDPQKEISAAIARAPGFVLKIALLMAWDFGSARTGQPWYVTPTELLPAIALAEFHCRSVVKIGEVLAGSKDMREKRDVFTAISDPTGTTLGRIMQRAHLLKRRANELIESLLEEGEVELHPGSGSSGTIMYRRKNVAALGSTATLGPAATLGVTEGDGAQVIHLFGDGSVGPLGGKKPTAPDESIPWPKGSERSTSGFNGSTSLSTGLSTGSAGAPVNSLSTGLSTAPILGVDVPGPTTPTADEA